MKIVQGLLTFLAFAPPLAVLASPIPAGTEIKREALSEAAAEAAPADYGNYGTYGTYENYPPPPPLPTSYGSYGGYETYKRALSEE